MIFVITVSFYTRKQKLKISNGKFFRIESKAYMIGSAIFYDFQKKLT